jgi:hypothetical protein
LNATIQRNGKKVKTIEEKAWQCFSVKNEILFFIAVV